MNNNSENKKPDMVTGIFKDKESADRAIAVLETKGYKKDEINVLMSDEIKNKFFKDEFKTMPTENKALKGAGAGSAIGLTAGALVAGIAAVGSVVIPGVGLIVAGPIAAALVGAGAAGVAGGLIGALIGWGIPEEKAKKYEKAIKEGKIIIGVKPHDSEDSWLIEKEWAAYREEPVFT